MTKPDTSPLRLTILKAMTSELSESLLMVLELSHARPGHLELSADTIDITTSELSEQPSKQGELSHT
ncbi:hypothetical protein PF003_g9715 [Phytophthora fragariae]|nr:hypothetical protein PF003_g9715 [Phytophthora fragariae]